MTDTTTRAAQVLENPDAIDAAAVERESVRVFLTDRATEVRRFADGSRIVLWASGGFEDYAVLEAEVIDVLRGYDAGAYGGSPTDVAEDWIRHGYDPIHVDTWLSVGVCFPSHADQLAAEGFAPDALCDAFTGWATDEAVDAYLHGPAAD